MHLPQSKRGLIVIIEHPYNASEVTMILNGLISEVLWATT